MSEGSQARESEFQPRLCNLHVTVGGHVGGAMQLLPVV